MYQPEIKECLYVPGCIAAVELLLRRTLVLKKYFQRCTVSFTGAGFSPLSLFMVINNIR